MDLNRFDYSRSMTDEVGIFIVCNDKALLKTINQMMRSKGLVAVSDTAGRQHYIVDGRLNPMIAARKFEELMFTDSGRAIEILGDKRNYKDELDTVIAEVLDYYDFDKSLYGTKLLCRALRIFMLMEGMNMKEIYGEAGKQYEMSSQQVERNIRYCIQKSMIWENGMKNYKAFVLLREEVMERIY